MSHPKQKFPQYIWVLEVIDFGTQERIARLFTSKQVAASYLASDIFPHATLVEAVAYDDYSRYTCAACPDEVITITKTEVRT